MLVICGDLSFGYFWVTFVEVSCHGWVIVVCAFESECFCYLEIMQNYIRKTSFFGRVGLWKLGEGPCVTWSLEAARKSDKKARRLAAARRFYRKERRLETARKRSALEAATRAPISPKALVVRSICAAQSLGPRVYRLTVQAKVTRRRHAVEFEVTRV